MMYNPMGHPGPMPGGPMPGVPMPPYGPGPGPHMAGPPPHHAGPAANGRLSGPNAPPAPAVPGAGHAQAPPEHPRKPTAQKGEQAPAVASKGPMEPRGEAGGHSAADGRTRQPANGAEGGLRVPPPQTPPRQPRNSQPRPPQGPPPGNSEGSWRGQVGGVL